MIVFIVSDYQRFHSPWGLPDGGAGKGGCILTQEEYISGFSTYLKVPLWVIYRLDGKVLDGSSLPSTINLSIVFFYRRKPNKTPPDKIVSEEMFA